MSNSRIVYPGSFDPITFGHQDIVSRAAKLFDHVVVAVANNSRKKYLLSLDERVELAQQELGKFSNVSVVALHGLLVDFAKKNNALFVLRGLRNTVDVSQELQFAAMNRKLSPEIETIFMTPSEEFGAISSTLVREIAYNDGNIEPFVGKKVALKLEEAVVRGK